MSASPPIADIAGRRRDVRFVPKADILRRDKGIFSRGLVRCRIATIPQKALLLSKAAADENHCLMG